MITNKNFEINTLLYTHVYMYMFYEYKYIYIIYIYTIYGCMCLDIHTYIYEETETERKWKEISIMQGMLHLSLNTLYIYTIYIYMVSSMSFQTFFGQAFKIAIDSWKFKYFIAIHLMRWLTNFYDSTFKWNCYCSNPEYPHLQNLIVTAGEFQKCNLTL